MHPTPNKRLRRLSLVALVIVLVSLAVGVTLILMGPFVGGVFSNATLYDCMENGRFVPCPTPEW